MPVNSNVVPQACRHISSGPRTHTYTLRVIFNSYRPINANVISGLFLNSALQRIYFHTCRLRACSQPFTLCPVSRPAFTHFLQPSTACQYIHPLGTTINSASAPGQVSSGSQRPPLPTQVVRQGPEEVRISGTLGHGTAIIYILKKEWCLVATPLMSVTIAEGSDSAQPP